ncbi:MAG: DNA mismatch repair endonuclease MutL [Kaiparowitsia implicata GSE-PSE-MK54-09C]|jgi:DNA mismatch repair protein MutL|nr:DNA mismatch repair endonuclease MutL [Kaiparowitsia implicata GSE-PSE-MK54-09C]
MGSQIQTLPDDVVHLMAAGEVIDSLAAVVRELAENAIDAGATRITITLWLEQWRIQVADNGAGITLENLQRAALPHSTNKIWGSADLWNIASLGFRGEALHSLAQLSELEISSRPGTVADGMHVRYSPQGHPVQTRVTAIAPGTIVTVSNLFHSLPSRRQSLPPAGQQLRLVQLVVQHLALCHPQVTWQVYRGEVNGSATARRDWFCLWGSPQAQAILPQILRTIEAGDLQTVCWPSATTAASTSIAPSLAESGMPAIAAPTATTPSQIAQGLEILLGLPHRCHRRRPDWIKVAVNGRVVRCPEVEQAVFSAFHRTLPRDRHPICFVHLHLSPRDIDWNRHPAKAEVYLQDMDGWRGRVVSAIHHALQLHTASQPDLGYGSRVNQLLQASEKEGGYNAQRRVQSWREGSSSTSVDEDEAQDRGDRPFKHSTDSPDPSPNPMLSLRAIAQLHHMYIVAEHPTGLWLIEQHIAHERVLYEQLCDRWQLVPIDSPIMLTQLSGAQVEQLQRLGMTVDEFGDQLWAVRTVPAALRQRDDCADALRELSLGDDLDSALVATACRTALRNGTPLALSEMQALLHQWQATRHPYTCPHGRPICLSLEESSLSRYFRRHWVIGKSHGI